MRFAVTGCCLLVGAGMALGVAHAANESGERAVAESPTTKTARSKPVLHVTPEREAAAMVFVRRHHAELAELLDYLKGNLPKDYERAIRELFRSSERLARLKETDDETRYLLELDLWKTQSRIQLLVAQVRMKSSDELEGQLRDLLQQRYELKLSLLRHDREKMAIRLKKLDEQIEKLSEERSAIMERSIKGLVQSAIGRPAKSKKPPASAKTEPTKAKSNN